MVGEGWMVEGGGLGVQGSGFRVQGSGFRVLKCSVGGRPDPQVGGARDPPPQGRAEASRAT